MVDRRLAERAQHAIGNVGRSGNLEKMTTALGHVWILLQSRASETQRLTENKVLCVSEPLRLRDRYLVAVTPPGRYVLLKLFLVFVTVNVPSCCAVTLMKYALPLCTGAGGACCPCGGGVQAAIGMVVSG